MKGSARIALLVATLLLVAAAAELALRISMPWLALPEFRPFGFSSRQFHHRYPPNTAASQPFNEGNFLMETNADGLRTSYTREAFRTHGTRIALLGDSFTFGSTVDSADAYPAVLEAELRRRGLRDAAVLNAAIISYSPLLEREQYRALVRHYAPTLVLVAVDLTDIGDDYFYAGQRVRAGDGAGEFDVAEVPPRHRAWESIALWNLTRPLHPWLFGARSFGSRHEQQGTRAQAPPLLIDGKAQHDRYFVLRYPLEKTRPYFETSLRHVQALARAAREDGAAFALVVGPRHFHWDLEEAPESWERHLYGDADGTWYFEFLRFFEEAAERVDFPVIELLPAFRASKVRPLNFYNDPHWNPAGHRVAGVALADALVFEGLVEP